MVVLKEIIKKGVLITSLLRIIRNFNSLKKRY